MDRESASRGGKTTVERHGKPHMAAIGAKGFAATVAKHHQGDKLEYLTQQRKRANQAVIEGLIEIDQRAKLDAGAEITCTELPVLLDPDDDFTFRDMVSHSRRGPASRAG